MAQEQLIHGIIAYPITPFDEAGIDTDRLTGLVDTMVNAGVHAIAPLGSTGESAYLSFDEWKTVVDTTIAAVAGRVPVVVGASDLTTAGTVARAEYAQQAGATAVDGDPGLLLGAQRARDRPALHLGERCDLDPDHGLQQPGDLWDRHVADAAEPHVRVDRERQDGERVHRRHPAHARPEAAVLRGASVLQRQQPAGAQGAARRSERLVHGRPLSAAGARHRPLRGRRRRGDRASQEIYEELRRCSASSSPRACPRRSSQDSRSSASRPAFRDCRCFRSIPRTAPSWSRFSHVAATV